MSYTRYMDVHGHLPYSNEENDHEPVDLGVPNFQRSIGDISCPHAATSSHGQWWETVENTQKKVGRILTRFPRFSQHMCM